MINNLCAKGHHTAPPARPARAERSYLVLYRSGDLDAARVRFASAFDRWPAEAFTDENGHWCGPVTETERRKAERRDGRQMVMLGFIGAKETQ